MKWITNAVLWIYDFLAEDITLLVGIAIAFLFAVGLVRVSAAAAGYVLVVLVAAVLTASIWRTVSAAQG